MRRVPPSRQVAGECALCRRSRRLAVSPCAERADLSATLTGRSVRTKGGVAIHSSTGDVGFAPADSPPRESGSFASSSSERASQLVRDAVLSHQPDCPVCGSPRRRLESNTSRLNRYIRAIPLVTPMRVSEIVDVLQAWLCEDCTTVYCDPWLSRSASAHLFTTGIGQHYDGWKVLYESVANDDGETHAHWREHTWARIAAIAGPVSTYAELNCLFRGLLPYFRRNEIGVAAYRRFARRARRSARSRRRHPRGILRTLRRTFDVRPPESPPLLQSAGAIAYPDERVLVLEPTAAGWGNGCVSQGVTCQSLASGLLAATLATQGDLERDGRCFDVAVLTQLDHFIEPMTVLERFLERSRLVVVACHLSNYFSKQHPFAFGPGIAEHFRSRGWSAVDLTPETVHPAKHAVNQCVFVSKQMRISS